MISETRKGHVSIVPNPTIYDYLTMMCDVPLSDVDRIISNTYTQTLTRVSHIRSLFGIEREFERYYMRLKNKVNSQMDS